MNEHTRAFWDGGRCVFSVFFKLVDYEIVVDRTVSSCS